LIILVFLSRPAGRKRNQEAEGVAAAAVVFLTICRLNLRMHFTLPMLIVCISKYEIFIYDKFMYHFLLVYFLADNNFIERATSAQTERE
jgi:hypothetical protein